MTWIKCEDQLPKVGELVIVASAKPNWEITVAEYTYRTGLCDVVAFKASQFNNPPKLNRNTNVDVR